MRLVTQHEICGCHQTTLIGSVRLSVRESSLEFLSASESSAESGTAIEFCQLTTHAKRRSQPQPGHRHGRRKTHRTGSTLINKSLPHTHRLSFPIPFSSFPLFFRLLYLPYTPGSSSSSSTHYVGPLCSPRRFQLSCLLVLGRAPDKGRRSRCCWRYRSTALPLAQDKSSRLFSEPLRYPWCSRCCS